MLIPFAQQEIVQTFMDGVHPGFGQRLDGAITSLMNELPEVVASQLTLLDAKQGGQLRRALKTVGREIQEMFRRHLSEFRQQNHRPIVSVLEHLPKEELAELAESLVHLTSTRRRVAMEAETVGGPIDVAVISKGDGFIWMKRKHYFRPELNPQFFARLQEEGKP